MPAQRVTVKVPATTANLGPAFDCMGMALDLFNTLTIGVSERPSFQITGEGETFLPRGPENRIFKAVKAAYTEMARQMPGLEILCHNEIPLMRGLGSSAAAVLEGLAAANALEGNPISIERLLDMAVETEGHPDNVAPALLGGCQIVVRDEQKGEKLITSRVKIAEGLKAVLFVPDFQMSTGKARALLTRDISRGSAIFNIGRTALLCNALSTGNWCDLAIATRDKLHQTAREAMFPAMPEIIEAALAAGAHGAFLSGAGSTIIAFATEKEPQIGEAMSQAAARAKVAGKTMTLNPTDAGTQILETRE